MVIICIFLTISFSDIGSFASIIGIFISIGLVLYTRTVKRILRERNLNKLFKKRAFGHIILLKENTSKLFELINIDAIQNDSVRIITYLKKCQGELKNINDKLIDKEKKREVNKTIKLIKRKSKKRFRNIENESYIKKLFLTLIYLTTDELRKIYGELNLVILRIESWIEDNKKINQHE